MMGRQSTMSVMTAKEFSGKTQNLRTIVGRSDTNVVSADVFKTGIEIF